MAHVELDMLMFVSYKNKWLYFSTKSAKLFLVMCAIATKY